MAPPKVWHATLLAVSTACSHAHSTPPRDSGAGSESDAGPPYVPGRRAPWSDLSIRFLGLTELGEPGGDDVELRWELTYAQLVGDERVEAIPFSDTGGWYGALVETEVSPEPARTMVRVRLAIDGAAVPGSVFGLSVGLTLELRRGGSAASWEVAPRYVRLAVPDPLGAPPPRDITFDGRLDIGLFVAPDVATRDGAWVMEPGTEYELAYRVHNRTAESLSVDVFARSPNSPGHEGILTIPADGFVDLPLRSAILDPDECTGGRDCHTVRVAVPSEDGWVDLITRRIVVS
ncbi:MAG: hypothetical protein KF729_32185 [Sandaracinaceae bacterium]|nr:hypothetical protein [Sandaracinaceae bacterium]